jgi:hypothetical protein
MTGQPCQVCGRSEKEKPTVFRNDPWCSDLCRKAYLYTEASKEALKGSEAIHIDWERPSDPESFEITVEEGKVFSVPVYPEGEKDEWGSFTYFDGDDCPLMSAGLCNVTIRHAHSTEKVEEILSEQGGSPPPVPSRYGHSREGWQCAPEICGGSRYDPCHYTAEEMAEFDRLEAESDKRLANKQEHFTEMPRQVGKVSGSHFPGPSSHHPRGYTPEARDM